MAAVVPPARSGREPECSGEAADAALSARSAEELDVRLAVAQGVRTPRRSKKRPAGPRAEPAAPHLSLGRDGETAAEAHVRRLGWRVLERNWRDGGRELDLICLDGETVVFVEVKTRGAGSLGAPADGLSRTKASRLVKAAMAYLSQTNGWDRPCRFDLAAVVPIPNGLSVELTHDVLDVAATLGRGHPAWQPW